MAIEISLKKSTANPTTASGLTLAEPVFNYSNNTLWIGKGSGNSPVWVGAGVCGASGGIAAGLTTQLPTHAAIKNYFDAVSSGFLGATVSYVATFNGATGAVTGVSSFNGLTGAVTGASLGANTFTGLQTLNAGLTSSFAYVSGGLTVGGNLYVNGNLTVSGGVTTSISEIVLIEDNIITLNSNVTGSPTENAGVEIERGTSANTQILWNETSDKWTFTNDGSVYYDIPTDYVGSFNGRTGAVQGVSSAIAGTGISVSGATGSVTITNIGVQSFNGLTGAVTGASLGANTFTALNSFNAGISSAGGTFSSLVRFSAGLSAAGITSSNITDVTYIYARDFGATAGLTLSANPNPEIANDAYVYLQKSTSVSDIGLLDIGAGTVQIKTVGGAFGSNPSLKLRLYDGDANYYWGAIGSDNTVITADRTYDLPDADGFFVLDNTISSVAVTSFNGNVGAVTGASLGANTFTALNSFNSGISSNGATLSGTVTAPTPAVGTNNTQVATTAFVQSEIVADTVTTFNGRTGAVQGVSAAVAGTGISISGSTGAVTITNIGVQSFNGLTGAVQGVSSAAAGTGISISAATGAITITNTGVQTFNGLTGAVTGASLGANTFTALNSFAVGISSNGGTFSALTRFTGGITTSTLHVSGGATFAGPNLVWFTTGLTAAEIRVGNQLLTSTINSTSVSTPLAINNDAGTQTTIGDFALAGSGTYVDVDDVSPLLKLNCPLGTITIGDVDGAYNGTSITVDDQSVAINLNGAVLCNSTVDAAGFITTGDVYFGLASAFLYSESATLGTTAANQTIASVNVYDGDALVDTNRTVEFFVQASHSSGYEALKVIAIHDGTNTYNTQYGLIRTGSSLCSSYTTTIATVGGGSKVIRLRATPTNTNTTFKVVETVIPV